MLWLVPGRCKMVQFERIIIVFNIIMIAIIIIIKADMISLCV